MTALSGQKNPKKSIGTRVPTRSSRSKKKKRTGEESPTYFLIAVELDETVRRRKSDKAHIYLAKTVVEPENRLNQLQRGAGPKFAVGHYLGLVPLPVTFRPTRNSKRADELLKRNLEAFVRQGHAVNNLPSSLEDEWVVYVLALSEEGKEKLLQNRDGTRKKGYVYVGQTSNSLEVRMAQHRGEQKSRTGRHLGARPTRDRRFELLYYEIVHTASHALERERQLADKYEKRNYLVDAGDVTPRKLRRKVLKDAATNARA